jgi:uncharacterized protein (UPF0276 family)
MQGGAHACLALIMIMFPAENYGIGVGLRHPHYEHFLNEGDAGVDWLEIISENYMQAHEGYRSYLNDLRRDYPIIMHGVALSIGSTDPLDHAYLRQLRALADALDVPWLSDHLCFTGVQHRHSHDLLPIPYTEEALAHLIPRIHHVQEVMGRPFAFENASTYLTFNGDTLSEPELLSELHRRTGCGILLDVNNVYVSARNHGWDARAYIDAIPASAIAQYHLAGHTDHGTHLVDTHNDHVADAVWDLFDYTLETKGARSTLIEWDEDIPPISVLLSEAEKARARVHAFQQKQRAV